jgi:hypothetical protein
LPSFRLFFPSSGFSQKNNYITKITTICGKILEGAVCPMKDY